MNDQPALLNPFKRDIDYYEEHREELLRQYPDDWIAILNQKVVRVGSDLDALLDGLRRQGVPPQHALIKRMTREEDILILLS